MKHLFFSLIAIFCLHTQDIQFYRSSLDYPILSLEEQMFKDVVELYNKKYKTNLRIIINKVPNVRLFLKEINTPKHLYTAIMSSITITKERSKLYLFSVPYMPIKETIFALRKETISYHWQNKRIAFLLNSTEENSIKLLQKRHPNIVPVAFNSFPEKLNSLSNGTADFLISDNVAWLSFPNLVQIEDLDLHQHYSYGIIYSKGSPLKKMLDPVIKYYILSSRFYDLLKKNYGKRVADYFTKNVKNVARR